MATKDFISGSIAALVTPGLADLRHCARLWLVEPLAISQLFQILLSLAKPQAACLRRDTFWHWVALAEDCERDGRAEFFLTSAPLRIGGGVGSPPNVLALK